MEVNGQFHALATLPPGTHWIGGWVGPSAILDTVVKRKIPAPTGLEPPSSSLWPSPLSYPGFQLIRYEKRKSAKHFVKIKLLLCLTKHHSLKTYGGVEVQPHAFQMEVSGQLHAPAALPPRKESMLPTG